MKDKSLKDNAVASASIQAAAATMNLGYGQMRTKGSFTGTRPEIKRRGRKATCKAKKAARRAARRATRGYQ